MAWATIAQLEEWLGLPQDARMVDALDVSGSYCARMRPDLPAAGPVAQDIAHAVVLYAALLYRERVSPEGFATYDEMGGDVSAADAMYNVRRLLGVNKPVAR